MVKADDEPVFPGMEAAYRRCVQLREPSYEYLRFRLEDGASKLLERLLLPCADAESPPQQLVGMVVFETLASH